MSNLILGIYKRHLDERGRLTLPACLISYVEKYEKLLAKRESNEISPSGPMVTYSFRPFNKKLELKNLKKMSEEEKLIYFSKLNEFKIEKVNRSGNLSYRINFGASNQGLNAIIRGAGDIFVVELQDDKT